MDIALSHVTTGKMWFIIGINMPNLDFDTNELVNLDKEANLTLKPLFELDPMIWSINEADEEDTCIRISD